MRTRIILGLLAVLAAVFLAAPAARGELEPPVTITLIGDPNLVPVPGQVFAASFRFESSEPITMRHVELPGRWEAMYVGLAWGDSLELEPGVPQDVPFEIMSNDITEPVQVKIRAGGRKLIRDFFLVTPHYELQKSGQSEVRQFAAPGEHPFPGVRTDFAMAAPITDGPEGWTPDPDFSDPEDQKVQDKDAAYAIRVRGRFCYQRPDGETVGVDNATIQVWDEDINPDDLLYIGVTDPYGYFDVTFDFDQSEAPDIYTRVIMANGEIHCAWLGYYVNTWVWRTHTKDDYGGNDIDYGWFGPADESHNAVPNVLSIGTRAWRWSFVRGYDPPQTYLYIPCGDHAYYSSEIPAICVGNPEFFWREGVVSHEYGHHWAKTMSNYVFYDGIYCNQWCDPFFPLECGHCDYSEENYYIAWTEGFPNWYAASVVEQYVSDYNETPFRFEELDDHEPGHTGLDPFKVEGCLSRLLYDIYDNNHDNDPEYPDGQDLLSLGSWEVLEIANVDRPVTPQEFNDDFLARHPNLRYEYWSTAWNNGYQLDHQAPSAVTNLTSPSHNTVESSPDGTIDYTWTTPADNMSDIGGYAVLVSENVITPPGYGINVNGSTNSYTTADLDPGIYYFNIRAVDRAGNWGGYAAYGPITIRDPYPADLAPFWALGWDYPIVPRNDNTAAPSDVHVPSVLHANTWLNYYNIAIYNHGELATDSRWDVGFYVDGIHYTTESIVPPVNLAAGGVRTWYNRGVFYMDPGRHMYSMWIDMEETNAEMNEADNRYGHQFIWEPRDLLAGNPVTSNHPPDPTGGMVFLFPGYSPNCDGYAVAAGSGTFVGGLLKNDDDTEDFDCRMFPHSTGSENGFDSPSAEAFSSRPAGCLDAVFFNKYNAAGMEHDVGVVNWPEGVGSYEIQRVESTYIQYDTEVSATLAADEYLLLRHFQLETGNVGWTTIQLFTDPSAGPIHLGYLPEGHTYGGLDDLLAEAVTDQDGLAVVSFNAPIQGSYGLVIWRDPVEIPATKGAGDKLVPELPLTIKVRPTPPDVLPVTAAGWYLPLVPRPLPDGTPASVPAPDSLPGNVASTYLNVAFRNQGPVGANEVLNAQQLDGEQIAEQVWPYVAPGQTRLSISYTPHTVRGGRHTLATILDGEETLEETNEFNNVFARQWVWSPLDMDLASPTTRAAPPDPEGGWDRLAATGEPLVMNCDGLGIPAPVIVGDDGYWLAAAVMPGDTSNIDIRLHDRYYGTEQGFEEVHTLSAWSAGQSDIVLVNSSLTDGEAKDVGVVRTSGMQDYTAEVVASVYLGRNPDGVAATGQIEARHILDLYEVYLDPGEITIRLLNQTGGADLGLTLHPPNVPYSFKANWVADGAAWRAGPGEDETVPVVVPLSGRYGLSVWKVGSADLLTDVQYQLTFAEGLSGEPEGQYVPKLTTIASIHPNPFNPMTTIEYELVSTGTVRLEVFNVRGQLVRCLVDGIAMQGGRHVATWNGRDNAGNPAPSGIYMVRLRAGGKEHYRKATLLQ
jgi:hypothetical protein